MCPKLIWASGKTEKNQFCVFPTKIKTASDSRSKAKLTNEKSCKIKSYHFFCQYLHSLRLFSAICVCAWHEPYMYLWHDDDVLELYRALVYPSRARSHRTNDNSSFLGVNVCASLCVWVSLCCSFVSWWGSYHCWLSRSHPPLTHSSHPLEIHTHDLSVVQ